MLGPEASDIWASTFHSACVRILRRDAERLGFPTSFTIYDTSDSLSLVKRILKDYELDDKRYPPRMLLSEISRAKDAQLSPEQFYAKAKAMGDIRKAKIAEIYDGNAVPVSPENIIIETYADHRMAMAFAPCALLLPGLRITAPEVVGKSYPDFWQHLSAFSNSPLCTF